MRAAGDEVLNTVVFFHLGARLTSGGSVLSLKGVYEHALDVALLGDENSDLLIGNE